MLQITSKKDCCGCNACSEVCPKHCIEMTFDSKGFLYPKIDANNCIECGLCEKVCPMIEKNTAVNFPVAAYAGRNKDMKQYLSSSSGGAAFVMSSHILEKGGVVYGCCSEGVTVRHIRVSHPSELGKLQGSKYVQSDVRGIFRQVKHDLVSGTPVLFIGTPCQVAGLKNFVRTVPDHLYLVDLICHGVPSQQMLQDHIDSIIGGHQIDHIAFRKGNDILLSLSGKDFEYEVNVWNEPYKDMYIRGFIDGLTYRPGCYACPFAKAERCSDITIGDFWGFKGATEIEKKNGLSVIIPSTEKGMAILKEVSDSIYMEESSVTDAVNGNTQLRKPTHKGIRGHIFNLLYPRLSFRHTMSIIKKVITITDIIYNLPHVIRR